MLRKLPKMVLLKETPLKALVKKEKKNPYKRSHWKIVP